MGIFTHMNYLAHALLSGPKPMVLVGNMMGDAIKGYGFLSKYEQEVSNGILLHRFIDEFTDTHPICKTGKKRLWQQYRHYSGVVIDMYYDHLLAKNWHLYHNEPLEDFAQTVYTTLGQHRELLPDETRMMVDHMTRYDWLANYQHLEGLNRALTGLSRRTTFISHMEKAAGDLYLNYDIFEEEFLKFFTEILTACHQKREKFNEDDQS